jgi:hypothetical protein
VQSVPVESLLHYSLAPLLLRTMTDTDTAAALNAAVDAMHTGDNVYDVTIVCTTDDHQAAYWMDRLAAGICSHATTTTATATKEAGANFPMVLAVSEDWGGAGAGNGLGTLYAFQKAHALALEKYGVDLTACLADGKVSAGLFHTAGKGTRMAPLPASENNNKPGVVRISIDMCINVYQLVGSFCLSRMFLLCYKLTVWILTPAFISSYYHYQTYSRNSPLD